MIENLQDKLYQLENKKAKTFLTMMQNILQGTWKTEYAKSNSIWIAITDNRVFSTRGRWGWSLPNSQKFAHPPDDDVSTETTPQYVSKNLWRSMRHEAIIIEVFYLHSAGESMAISSPLSIFSTAICLLNVSDLPRHTAQFLMT